MSRDNSAGAEFLSDLDLAESWYKEDVQNASGQRARQLRYSLCNKLAADWQKFVKASARAAGVQTAGLGNCWPSQVRTAWRTAGLDDPLYNADASLLKMFDAVNPVRNAIDHGDEPEMPSNTDLESWMAGLRAIAARWG